MTLSGCFQVGPDWQYRRRETAGVREMSDTQFDQNAWLARIGYSGPVTPTLETLNRLIFAHSQSIAYETLDIMLGRPPKLDVPTLQHKMIASKRGGYCFEQNMLFRAGLRSLGYRITSLQGRVVRGLAIDAPRPAIHMLLKVELLPDCGHWTQQERAAEVSAAMIDFLRQS
jgi:arylamine N-acetyltransferase